MSETGTALRAPFESDSLLTGTPQSGSSSKRKVSPFKFVFILYFLMCGGPFGLEEVVGLAYPLISICLIVIIPLIYTFPLSLIVSELGTALPTNEGVVEWVNYAFGPHFSFVLLGADFITYVIDLAIYPLLFVEYLAYVSEDLSNNWAVGRFVPLGVFGLCLLFNLAGIDFISSISSLLAIAIITPFVVMFVWTASTGRMNPHDWLTLPPGNFDLAMVTKIGAAFNVVIWCYCGVDSVGQIVEDLQDTNKNLIRTLVSATFITMISYLVAIVGPLSLDTNYANWDAGYFVVLAEILGGAAFKWVIVALGMVSNFGQLMSMILPASEQLQALCGEEYLELNFMLWESSWGVPIPAVLTVSILGMIVMQFISFVELVSLQMLIYSCVVIAICASATALRITEKGKALERPFKVFGTDHWAAIVVCGFIPTLISLVIIGFVAYSNWVFVCVLLGIWFILFVVYNLCGYRRELRDMEARRLAREVDPINS